jgi:peptidylprolyl isomerase
LVVILSGAKNPYISLLLLPVLAVACIAASSKSHITLSRIKMTLNRTSLLLLAAVTTAATAQTTATRPAAKPSAAPAHAAAAPTHTAAAEVPCSKLPELSPKIPALPPGLPCAKPLYTITIEPSVKLDYISSLEGPELRKTLGLESTSFSLDYIDVQIGTGELATPGKFYTLHYTGYLTDGTKFDSSVDRGQPFSFPYGGHQVIPGWDTGFAGMRMGGKRRLFIPYELAYGANGKPPIPPKAELIFDVELISQSDSKPADTPATTAVPPDSASPRPATPGPAPAHPATSPNPNSK